MVHTITHELKTWKRFFEEILSGNKKFELRKNDREFKIDDIIKLSEYNNNIGYYTGRFIIVKITYILERVKKFGLQEGFCIFSFDIIEKDERFWVYTMYRQPETSSVVMCKVWDEVLKTTSEYMLRKGDCDWRTVEDNSEIDPNLKVLSWKEDIMEDIVIGIKEEKLKQASADFQQACNERLAHKEAKGYTGWDGEHSSEDLLEQLICDAHDLQCLPSEIDHERLIDISNRAMMLWHRANKTYESK